MQMKPTVQHELPHRLVRQEGPTVRWRVQVSVAEGQQFIELSKPFARLGAEKRSELWLPALGAPVAVFMHATNEGVFVYDLSCPGVFARHAAGVWKTGQEIVVGPYRLTLLEYRYLGLAQTVQGPMYELDIETKKPGRNVFRPMHSVAFLGQSARCDLRLRHRSISELHCAFLEFPEGLMVVDLFSVGGVWIHNAEVDQSLLRHGDQVRCGEVDLVAKRSTEGVSEGSFPTQEASPVVVSVEDRSKDRHSPGSLPESAAARKVADSMAATESRFAEQQTEPMRGETRSGGSELDPGGLVASNLSGVDPITDGSRSKVPFATGSLGEIVGKPPLSPPAASSVTPWRSLRGDKATAHSDIAHSAVASGEPMMSGVDSARSPNPPMATTATAAPPFNGVSRGASRVQRGPTVIVAEQPRQEMSVMERIVESRKLDAARAFRWKVVQVLTMFLAAALMGWAVWSRIPTGWRSLILNSAQQPNPPTTTLDAVELGGSKSKKP